MAEHFIKNIGTTQAVFNLPKKEGKRQTLHLSRGEVSRPLTDEEFHSAEVQKGISKRQIMDITRLKQRKR